ncbi:MAG: hypothetical protein UY87_C0048G0005 [Candidatus Peribacteria bacterium GW2011_GWC2_54_8]|nr:MAG: hypothetical protein UY87_C0048G0005 [Candidatus Peribacteria bacterium GW2011_GWC2_54_8]
MEALEMGIPKAQATTDLNQVFTSMTVTLAVVVTAVNLLGFITFPILEVLLNPRFFLELHGANEVVIHQIWQVSREIMNIIFAFMLVVGACLTVVTAKKDIISRFAIKFVLGVILVNFSWFFPRVILDVGHVLAATIYKLPDLVSTTCRYYDINGIIQTPCKYPYDFRFFDKAAAIAKAAGGPASLGYECPLETVCYRVQALANNTNTAPGILSGLIFNHGKLPDLAKVPNFNGGGMPATDPLDQISFFLMFLLNTVFLISLSVALTLALIAMMVAFIIRIPVLWLTIAFMPFMFLGYVVGDLMGNFNTMKIFKKFVAAAFLPAIVAIPFTVGFIVLNAIAFSAPVGSAIILADSQGRFLPGIDNLWIVLWQITTILIIWKGFFMALSIDSMYEEATKGIRSMGANLGSFVTHLPLNIPFIPGAKEGGKQTYMSAGQAMTAAGGLSNLSRQGRLLEGDAVKNMLTGGRSGGVEAAEQNIRNSGEVYDRIKAAAGGRGDMQKVAEEMRKLSGSLSGLSPEKQAEALQRALKNTGISLNPAQIQELTNALHPGGDGSGRGRAGSGNTPPAGGAGRPPAASP